MTEENPNYTTWLRWRSVKAPSHLLDAVRSPETTSAVCNECQQLDRALQTLPQPLQCHQVNRDSSTPEKRGVSQTLQLTCDNLMGETSQQGESTSSSNQRGTATSASSRAEDTGPQDTCRVFVVFQPHTPAFQGSLAQRGTAPELLFHRAKGWKGINDHKTQHF